jgi:hypothetical protein
MPVTETRTTNTRNAGRVQASAMKSNKVAMLHLTLAFETAGKLNLVEEVKTSDWPGGLAHLVVAALFKKYHPQDTRARVELRQMLYKIKMKKNEVPTVLYERISRIVNKYNMTTMKKIGAHSASLVGEALLLRCVWLCQCSNEHCHCPSYTPLLERLSNSYHPDEQSSSPVGRQGRTRSLPTHFLDFKIRLN